MTSTDNQPTNAPTGPADNKLARWIVIAVLCAFLVAACVLGYLGWTSTDTSVPISGYIAMAFGVIFSLAVGVGLMALLFYSSRAGYDEPAVLIPEPEDDGDAGKKDDDKGA